MKRFGKKIAGALLCCGFAGCTVAGVASCSQKAEAYRFENYSESIAAEIGRECIIPEVGLEGGELECVSVYRGDSEISVADGKFIPDSFDPYTIIYVFIVGETEVVKETNVIVEDTQGPEIRLELSAEQIIAGEEVRFTVSAEDVSGPCDIFVTVTDPFGWDAPLKETDAFVAETEGYWVVTATAQDSKGFKSTFSKRVLAMGEAYGVVNLFNSADASESADCIGGSLSFATSSAYEGNGALKFVPSAREATLFFPSSAALAEQFDHLTVDLLFDAYAAAEFSFGLRTESGDKLLTKESIFPDVPSSITVSTAEIARVAAGEKAEGFWLSYVSDDFSEETLYVDGIRFGYDDLYVTEGESVDLSVFDGNGLYQTSVTDEEGQPLDTLSFICDETGIFSYRYKVALDGAKDTEFVRSVYVRSAAEYGVASRFDDETDILDLSAQGVEYGITAENSVNGTAAYMRYGSELLGAKLTFTSERLRDAGNFDYLSVELYLDTESPHEVEINRIKTTLSAGSGWKTLYIPLTKEAIDTLVFSVDNASSSENGTLYIDEIFFGWNAIESGVGYETEIRIEADDRYEVSYFTDDSDAELTGSVFKANAAGTYTVEYLIQEKGTQRQSRIERTIIVYDWPDYGDYFGGVSSDNADDYLRAIDYEKDEPLPLYGVEAEGEFEGLSWFETNCQWPLAYFENKAALNQLRVFDAIELEIYYVGSNAHIFYLSRDKVGADNAATVQYNNTKPNQWNTIVLEKGTTEYRQLFGTAFDDQAYSSNLCFFFRNTDSGQENLRVYVRAIRGVFRDTVVGTNESIDIGLGKTESECQVSGGTLDGTVFRAENPGEYTVTYTFSGYGMAITQIERKIKVVTYTIQVPDDEMKSLNTWYVPAAVNASDESGTLYNTVVAVTAPDGSEIKDAVNGFELAQEGVYTISYRCGSVVASYQVTVVVVEYVSMETPENIDTTVGEVIRIVGAEVTDTLGGKFEADVRVTDASGKEVYIAPDGTFFARTAGEYTVTHTLGELVKTAKLTIAQGDREIGEIFDFDKLSGADINQYFNWQADRGTVSADSSVTATGSATSLKVTAENPNRGLYWYYGSKDTVASSSLDIKNISDYEYIVIQIYVPANVVAEGVSTGVMLSSWGDNGKGEIELVGGLNLIRVASGEFLDWFGSLTEIKGYYVSSPYCYYMQIGAPENSEYVRNLEMYILSFDAVTRASYTYGTYMEAGEDSFNGQDVPGGTALPVEVTERNGETSVRLSTVSAEGTLSLWPGFKFTDLRILNSLRTYDRIVFDVYFETTDGSSTYPLALYMQRNRGQGGTTYQFPGPNGGYYNGTVEHSIEIVKGSDAWNTLFGKEFVSGDDLYFFANNPTKQMSLYIWFSGFEGRMDDQKVSVQQSVDLSFEASDSTSVAYSVRKDGAATEDAQIDGQGMFTAKAAGEYVVVYTVTYDGNKTAEIFVNVSVSDIPYGYVSMETPEDMNVAVGEVIRIVGAEVTDTLGEKFEADVRVTDASGKEVYIAPDGTFFARTAGEYTVTHTLGELVKTAKLTIAQGDREIGEIFDFDKLSGADINQYFNWQADRGTVSADSSVTATGSATSLKVTAENPNRGLYWYYGSTDKEGSCTLDIRNISEYEYIVIQIYIPASVAAEGVSTGVTLSSWGDNGKGQTELVGGLNVIKISSEDFLAWFGSLTEIKGYYGSSPYCYYMQIGAPADSEYVRNLEMYILSFDAVTRAEASGTDAQENN